MTPSDSTPPTYEETEQSYVGASHSGGSASAPAQEVEDVVAHWNKGNWVQVAQGLEQLLLGDASDQEKRVIRHYHAICTSYLGQYKEAKKLFEAELSNLAFEDEDSRMDALDISAAHWLGDTCLVLREMDDAALAWSIAYKGLSKHEGDNSVEKERLLNSLYFLNDGSLLGDALSRRDLPALCNALSANRKTKVQLFRFMSNHRKSNYIASVLDDIRGVAKPDTSVPAFDMITSKLQLTNEPFRFDFDSPTIGNLQFDPLLLLDPKKFQYVGTWGLEVNYAQLDLRFWPNLHQEYQFFSKIPIMSLYSTRKRSLKWMVSTLETELNARGMLCTHYFDRMKVIRVRNFGSMDYVAAFVIIFIRTPLYTVFGVQVPNHLVRTSWGTVRAPEFKARSRVAKEVKEILVNAEANSDADDPRFDDIIVGSSEAPVASQAAHGTPAPRYTPEVRA